MWWIAIASTPRWVWVKNWGLLKVVAKSPVNLLSHLAVYFDPRSKSLLVQCSRFLSTSPCLISLIVKNTVFQQIHFVPPATSISFRPCKRPAQSGRHELPQARLSSHPLWAPNNSKISGLKTCWPRHYKDFTHQNFGVHWMSIIIVYSAHPQ